MPKDLSRAAIFLALLCCASCGRLLGHRGPGDEDRGPLLAQYVSGTGVPNLAWLPGDAEIAYVVSYSSELAAVRVADGTSSSSIRLR